MATSPTALPSRKMRTDPCPLASTGASDTPSQKCEAKAAMNFATRSRRNVLAGFSELVKPLNSPKQGLAAVQDNGKIGQGMFGDVFLDALQQPVQHIGVHELRLVINGGIAEPVTIGAVDVASRCNLHKHLRDRLIRKGDEIWVVSRHADTAWARGNDDVT